MPGRGWKETNNLVQKIHTPLIFFPKFSCPNNFLEIFSCPNREIWFQLKPLQHLIDQEVFDYSALIKAKELLKSHQSKAEETVQNNVKKKEKKQVKTDEGKSQRTLSDVMRSSCSKSD